MERVLEQFTEVRAVPTATPGAEAWTARDPLPDGRERAILIKRLPDDAPARAHATHALALSHPAIVATRRWLRDGGQLYVVRDFLPGESLRRFAGDAAQRAFDRLLLLLSPVLDAIEYAGEAGLPHGGVSTENVLVSTDGHALLSDFAPVRHGSIHIPRDISSARSDLWGICELFKTLLPTRPQDDDAGQKARARLLKSIEGVQDKAQTPAALRDALETIGQMADLLGFSSHAEADGPRVGPRLVWSLYPPEISLPAGGGAGLALRLFNGGDADLTVDTVQSDAVWLNPYERPAPFVLPPAARRDLLWTASGARLSPGRYEPHLIVQSGEDGHYVSVPILVTGEVPPAGDAPPLAEEMPEPAALSPQNDTLSHETGIAVTQEPDPAVTSLGQNGVVHLGVRNVGPTRLRIDKITTSPTWLTYPGVFSGLWIEPGHTEYLGFSVVGAGLPGGDFKAGVLFAMSVLTETLMGMEPVRREMHCDVRVRVVRGAAEAQAAADKAVRGPGCGSATLFLLAAVGMATWRFWSQ